MEGFSCFKFRGLIFRGAYTWRGLFLELYSVFLNSNALPW